ncbi:S25 ribosomal protein-domain-containing protein [Verticillium dahliae]|nr:S25 ribosomal protein-domain-containing protein [Verticillium dahliae]
MAPAAGAKKQKKKWSKGKVKDKAQHAVILDKQTSEKLYKDVQSFRLVTVATLVDRMKINGSLARRCIKDLEEKGLIRPVVQHSKMQIYSMFARHAVTRGIAANKLSPCCWRYRLNDSPYCDGHDFGFASLGRAWPGFPWVDITARPD